MAITSENKTPILRRYTNSQLSYAAVYEILTTAVLLILNVFCSKASQRLICRNQESAMIEKCLLAADQIAQLDIINASTVERAVEDMGSLTATRLIITNHMGLALYDSSDAAGNRYILLPEIITAIEGNDVFSWQYHDGVMYSHAATPVVSYGTTLGCVYMMEYDTAQGALIQSIQNTVLQITIVLEILVILFSLAFSGIFSHRLRKIMASMRVIQKGDYTHKVRLNGRDELRFLADEFNKLTQKLQTSEGKRRQFVSDASHELKTPLASIKLLSDSILQNEMDMETIREFVGDIGNEADRLNRTTAKLLSLTRLDEQTEENSEIIHMTPTVERAVRMLSGIAQSNNIQLITEIQKDIPVLITEDDLYEITFNLLENGIKYNTPGGTLTVRLHQQEENAVLQVIDTGVGIPADALQHIFERFYRVDKARSRASGGSGLGLSIVKNIVAKNGGNITVESTMGKGSVFTVTFPVFDMEADAT